jgi:isopenicillin N synthase-like dioxygenase
MLIHEISMAPILVTLERTRRGTFWSVLHVDDRLDIPYQTRGDFKETFNMGRFADPEYQQNLPPIITSHWDEIQQFQKQCQAVTLKVLTLFALALNVPTLA